MKRTFTSVAIAGLVLLAATGCTWTIADDGSVPSTTAPKSARTPTTSGSETSADTASAAIPASVDRGAVRATSPFGSVSAAEIQTLLDTLQLPDLRTAKYGINLWQVRYETVDVDGTATTASGTVIVPDGAMGPLPVVSDQHGTQTARLADDAGPMEREIYLAGVLFASQGYVVAGADYLGLGADEGVHPYYHADTEASASLDMLKALREVAPRLGIEVGPQLFLTGYSQGAHATMALHRAIEQGDTGFAVTASAPMDGAYDLDSVSVPMALEQPTGFTPLYLAYALVGLDQVYDITDEWSTVFRAPYDERVPTLFDGTHKIDLIVGALPADHAELFQVDFLEDLRNGRGRFATALRANNVHDWRPDAPVRLFHGSADRDVPIRNARVAADRMRELGGDVQVIDLGPLDHESASMPAYLGAKAWFDKLLTNA